VGAEPHAIICRRIVNFLVGGSISAVLTILELTPLWIAGDAPSSLPSIDALVTNATSPITWANSGDFLITDVQLNGGLQLGGNPFDIS
jgi:hypothetical protein